jgi:hypothetical protein
MSRPLALGRRPRLASNVAMIQMTSRLSRGARLRKGGSAWPLAVLAGGGFLAAILLAIFHH